jgi:hypothetical protein
MTRARLVSIVLASVVVSLLFANAEATTWLVKQDGSGDATTIQAGINLSATGDAVLVFPGTYTGTMNRALHFDGKNILLQSTAGAAVTTIDCQQVTRAFDLSAGETANAIIDGFTILNGRMSAGGAIRCSGSSPTIRNNVLTSCIGEFGTIYCSSSSAYIHDNEIYLNGQLQFTHGGGIYSSNSSLTIERNDIHNNIGGGGGGIYIDGGSCEIIDNTIEHNTKLGENASSGGGIYCSSGTHTIRGNTINGNYGGNGGGIYIEGSGLVEDNIISNNEADYAGPMVAAQGIASPPDQPAGFGGGIYCSGAITVSGNRITGNNSFCGGGIFCVGSVSIVDNLIVGNYSWVNPSRSVGGSGGGIYVTGGSPQLEGNTISANEARGTSYVVVYGGGIYVDEGCVPILDRCIVSGNTVTNNPPVANVGGGIYVHGGMAKSRGSAGNMVPLSTMNVSCSDVWGNDPENYAGNIGDPTGTSCNISEDPLFCDSSPEPYSLRSDSPCLPGNHSPGCDCGLMGALGFGCAVTSPIVWRVQDVGNDQGRFVTLSWYRSRQDSLAASTPVVGYEVYRRIDELPSPPMVSDDGTIDPPAKRLSDALLYPPGDWYYLFDVPAHGEDTYNVVAPTLEDSCAYNLSDYLSTFFVRAVTQSPMVYFDSAPDSGYSVDNLSPAPPSGLYMASGSVLQWNKNTEKDLACYRVFAKESLENPSVLLGTTTETSYDVSAFVGSGYHHFAVTARDFNGNESPIDLGDWIPTSAEGELPTAFRLAQNFPNPFNPTTVIRYDVPKRGALVLSIHDASGRLVRTLKRGVEEPGHDRLEWQERCRRRRELGGVLLPVRGGG